MRDSSPTGSSGSKTEAGLPNDKLREIQDAASKVATSAPLGSVLRQASTPESEPKCVRLRGYVNPWPRHETSRRRFRDEIPKKIQSEMRAVVFEHNSWPLFMWGAVGSGKTYAALVMLDYAAGSTHYWTVEELCEHLIACDKGQVDTGGVHPATVSRREYWKELMRSNLVVLDELATRVSASDHHIETVKRVLEIREGVPLIVISNLSADAMEKVYGDRIASRVSAGTIIDWSGYSDRRLQHHRKSTRVQ